MDSSASRVGSREINRNIPTHNPPSKLKTYGFAIAIIVGIGGLAVGATGLAGYFHGGALSNMAQVNAIIMMAASGGGVILLIVGIVGTVKNRKPVYQSEVPYGNRDTYPSSNYLFTGTNNTHQAEFNYSLQPKEKTATGTAGLRVTWDTFGDHLNRTYFKNFSFLRGLLFGQQDIDDFKALVDQLPDINAPLPKQPDCADADNPLMLIAKFECQPIEYLDVLVHRGANFNYQSPERRNTPLIWAIANANNTMALEIINKGKEQNFDLRDRNGATALHLAITKGYRQKTADGDTLTVTNMQIINALLMKGANPNIVDNFGVSPLRIAVLRRDPEMVDALLEAGARIDFNWEVCLNIDYHSACHILGERCREKFLLDRAAFEMSKDTVAALLKKMDTSLMPSSFGIRLLW